jgi:hypothetical protein
MRVVVDKHDFSNADQLSLPRPISCGPSASPRISSCSSVPPHSPAPGSSPAKARLIAQLQRRQRERELEALAAEEGGDAAALYHGLAVKPPAALPPRAAHGLVLVSGACMIPHVAKRHTGGEDAYFVSDAWHGSFAVSDGVSSWADDGVDPGDYSRALVTNLRHLMEALPPPGQGEFEGRVILRRAQMATVKPGSATVLLAALRPRQLRRGRAGAGAGAAAAGMCDLHISNLGDCGVRVVRDGKIVLATQVRGRGLLFGHCEGFACLGRGCW